MATTVWVVWAWLAVVSAEPLRVASFHPIATDWLHQLGGEQVSVVAIAKAGDAFDPHTFQPTASDIRALEDCRLIFVMGKRLEPYLQDLTDGLREGQQIVEIGRKIPSLKVTDDAYACCPIHSSGGIDPHWWHNVRHAQRAVKIVAKALAEADAAHEDLYAERGKVLAKQLEDLHAWVKAEVSKIPRKYRQLVTAHAAFVYFCKEYGFQAAYVKGLSPQSDIGTAQLAEMIAVLSKKDVRAVFPEETSNPKMLEQVALELGCRFGQPLDADGANESYQAMIRGNVSHIVEALVP